MYVVSLQCFIHIFFLFVWGGGGGGGGITLPQKTHP